MITELTKAQEDMFPHYIKKWTDHGLCCDPMDKVKAKAAIHLAYEKAGLNHPKYIVWTKSPMANGIVWAHLKKQQEELIEKLKGGHSEEYNLYREHKGTEYKAEELRFKAMTERWVEDDQGFDETFMKANGLHIDEVRKSTQHTVYGNHNAGWVSFYDFFKEECGLITETEKIEGISQCAKECGWFIPMTDCCIVSERHSSLYRDAEGRLHSLEGPAIAYPDGYELYFIHGIRMDKRIVMEPETITTDEILATENVEVRRVLTDMYGLEKFMPDCGATIIDEDERFGKLWKKEMDDDEDLVVAEFLNSTPEPDGTTKIYFIRMPPEMTCIHTAVAWGFGMTKEQYSPQDES